MELQRLESINAAALARQLPGLLNLLLTRLAKEGNMPTQLFGCWRSGTASYIASRASKARINVTVSGFVRCIIGDAARVDRVSPGAT